MPSYWTISSLAEWAVRPAVSAVGLSTGLSAGLSALGRHDLPADLASRIRLRVHVDVPLAGVKLLRLFGGERGFALDRALDGLALLCQPNDRRAVLARSRRSVEMGHGCRPRQSAIGDVPCHHPRRRVIAEIGRCDS